MKKSVLVQWVIGALVIPHIALGATVTIGWENLGDPSDHFKVHWGIESGKYTKTADALNKTQYTVKGLEPGQTYYFTISAYNEKGPSGFSKEIVITIPEINKNPPVNPVNPHFKNVTLIETESEINLKSKTIEPK